MRLAATLAVVSLVVVSSPPEDEERALERRLAREDVAELRLDIKECTVRRCSFGELYGIVVGLESSMAVFGLAPNDLGMDARDFARMKADVQEGMAEEELAELRHGFGHPAATIPHVVQLLLAAGVPQEEIDRRLAAVEEYRESEPPISGPLENHLEARLR